MRHRPFRPSRPAVGLVLGAVLAAALVAPCVAPVRAGGGGKGAANAFWDLVAQSPVIALIVIKEAPPEARAWTIEVQRAYRGTAEGMLTVAPSPSDPAFQPGERMLYFGQSMDSLAIESAIARFSVDPDGRIVAPDDLADVPATLADFDAVLGPPMTSAPAAAPQGPPTRDQLVRDALPLIALAFVLGVLGVGLLAAWAAGRHIARPT
jgi:hypothetical protein